jgi:hypothetical protein
VRRSPRGCYVDRSRLGLAQPAPASHPMMNEHVTAAYPFKVGGFECTVVSDGPLKPSTFTAELFKGMRQERIDEILAANFLDKNDFTDGQNASGRQHRLEAPPV